MDSTEWLIQGLTEGGIETRWWFIDKLGRSNDPRAVIPLCRVLDDTLPASQYPPAPGPGTYSDGTLRKSAEEALVRLGETAVMPLCDALQKADPGVRWRIAALLGRIGDRRAVPALCQALKDSDAQLRRMAVRVLNRMGDRRTLMPLCEALKDKDWQVRCEAIEALDRLGGEQVVQPLTEALQEYTGETARRAAVALIRWGDSRAISPLCKALEEGCAEAVEALGEIALRDPVPELRIVLPLLRRQLFVGPFDSPEKREARTICRRTIQRIEMATAPLQSLPVPVAAASGSTEALPVPAGTPLPETADLPQPAGAPSITPESFPVPAAAVETGACTVKGPQAQRQTRRRTPQNWWRRLARGMSWLWEQREKRRYG